MEDVKQSIDIWPDTVSVLPLIIGIALAVLAWYLWRRQWRFLRDSIKTTGQVIGYESRKDRGMRSGTLDVYAPMIRYTAQDGSAREFVDSLSSSKKRYAPGDPVRIRYLPNDNQASVDSFLALYGAQIICTLVAAGFIFVAFLPD